MTSGLTTLLMRSAGLLLLTAMLFWAVLGAALARRRGRSRASGALISGLLPGVGALVLLLLHDRAQREAPAPAAPPPAPAAPAPSATPAWGSPPSAPAQQSGWGSPYAGATTWGSPSTWSTEPQVGVPLPAWTPAPQPLTPASAPGPDPAPRSSMLPALILTPVALACVLLLAALLEPWLVARVSGTRTSYTGGASPVTALPLLAAVLLLAGAAALHLHRPRGSWPVLGAAVGATAILLSLQLILVTQAVGEVLAGLSEYLPESADVTHGSGAILLLLAGICATAWSIGAIVSCPPRAASSRTGGS